MCRPPSILVPEIELCRGLPRVAVMHKPQEMPLTLGSVPDAPWKGAGHNLGTCIVALGNPMLSLEVLMGKMQRTQQACLLKAIATGARPRRRVSMPTTLSGLCFLMLQCLPPWPCPLREASLALAGQAQLSNDTQGE